MTTGTFGPDLLRALNRIGDRIAALEQERSALLMAYSDGRLPPGSFAWDDQTGAWEHTPTEQPALLSSPASAPPEGPEAVPT